MVKTYFKIAWRNFKHNKIFSLVNIIGLSVGLACCLLISLYILDEASYDAYQKNAANIYQVATTFIMEGKQESRPSTPSPMAATMKLAFPEIEQSARLMGLLEEDKTLLQYRDQKGTTKSFYETKGYLADSGFFKIFTYNFIEGNAVTALNEPKTIVLSEEIAKNPVINTKMQWIVFVVIFIPIAIGIMIFGWFALKGEYDHLPESSAEVED